MKYHEFMDTYFIDSKEVEKTKINEKIQYALTFSCVRYIQEEDKMYKCLPFFIENKGKIKTENLTNEEKLFFTKKIEEYESKKTIEKVNNKNKFQENDKKRKVKKLEKIINEAETPSNWRKKIKRTSSNPKQNMFQFFLTDRYTKNEKIEKTEKRKSCPF